MLGPSSGSTPTPPAASAVTKSLRQATSTDKLTYLDMGAYQVSRFAQVRITSTATSSAIRVKMTAIVRRELPPLGNIRARTSCPEREPLSNKASATLRICARLLVTNCSHCFHACSCQRSPSSSLRKPSKSMISCSLDTSSPCCPKADQGSRLPERWLSANTPANTVIARPRAQALGFLQYCLNHW